MLSIFINLKRKTTETSTPSPSPLATPLKTPFSTPLAVPLLWTPESDMTAREFQRFNPLQRSVARTALQLDTEVQQKQYEQAVQKLTIHMNTSMDIPPIMHGLTENQKFQLNTELAKVTQLCNFGLRSKKATEYSTLDDVMSALTFDRLTVVAEDEEGFPMLNSLLATFGLTGLYEWLH